MRAEAVVTRVPVVITVPFLDGALDIAMLLPVVMRLRFVA
jgi:hypothetical protein